MDSSKNAYRNAIDALDDHQGHDEPLPICRVYVYAPNIVKPIKEHSYWLDLAHKCQEDPILPSAFKMNWNKLLALTMGNLPTSADLQVHLFGPAPINSHLKPNLAIKRLAKLSDNTITLVDCSPIREEEWNDFGVWQCTKVPYQTKDQPTDHVLRKHYMTPHFRPRYSNEGEKTADIVLDLSLQALADAEQLQRLTTTSKRIFYFYGGDSNFLPLYERLVELGIKVVVYGWEHSVSASIDRFKPITFKALDMHVGHFASFATNLKTWLIRSETAMDPAMNEKLMLETISLSIRSKTPEKLFYGMIGWDPRTLTCVLQLYFRKDLDAKQLALYETAATQGFLQCLKHGTKLKYPVTRFRKQPRYEEEPNYDLAKAMDSDPSHC